MTLLEMWKSVTKKEPTHSTKSDCIRFHSLPCSQLSEDFVGHFCFTQLKVKLFFLVRGYAILPTFLYKLIDEFVSHFHLTTILKGTLHSLTFPSPAKLIIVTGYFQFSNIFSSYSLRHLWSKWVILSLLISLWRLTPQITSKTYLIRLHNLY